MAQEINQDPRILPNFTLGYNLFDTYYDGRLVSNAMLDMHSSRENNIPNYNCGRRKNLLTVIEGAESDISTQISSILGLYKIPQISSGFSLNDKTQFPFAYRMIPKEETQYMGIIKLLLHFGWTWIGLFAPDNYNGERFLNALTPLMVTSGICVAFTERITQKALYEIFLQGEPPDVWTLVNVFVFFGDSHYDFGSIIRVQMLLEKSQTGKRIWVTTAFQDMNSNLSHHIDSFRYTHGSLSFAIKTRKRTKYEYYVPLSFVTSRFWSQSFHCLCPSTGGWTTCTEKRKLVILPQEEIERALSQDSYIIYNSVQAVAFALNSAYLSRSKQMLMVGGRERLELRRLQPWQVQAISTQNYHSADCNMDYSLVTSKAKEDPQHKAGKQDLDHETCARDI
ncbi:vomeronasal type-2 receptor 26-like [Podarcis muralis]